MGDNRTRLLTQVAKRDNTHWIWFAPAEDDSGKRCKQQQQHEDESFQGSGANWNKHFKRKQSCHLTCVLQMPLKYANKKPDKRDLIKSNDDLINVMMKMQPRQPCILDTRTTLNAQCSHQPNILAFSNLWRLWFISMRARRMRETSSGIEINKTPSVYWTMSIIYFYNNSHIHRARCEPFVFLFNV